MIVLLLTQALAFDCVVQVFREHATQIEGEQRIEENQGYASKTIQEDLETLEACRDLAQATYEAIPENERQWVVSFSDRSRNKSYQYRSLVKLNYNDTWGPWNTEEKMIDPKSIEQQTPLDFEHRTYRGLGG